jgi:hypothetical protein
LLLLLAIEVEGGRKVLQSLECHSGHGQNDPLKLEEKKKDRDLADQKRRKTSEKLEETREGMNVFTSFAIETVTI